jgi:hypothetical protein
MKKVTLASAAKNPSAMKMKSRCLKLKSGATLGFSAN